MSRRAFVTAVFSRGSDLQPHVGAVKRHTEMNRNAVGELFI